MRASERTPIGLVVMQLGIIFITREAAAEIDEFQAANALMRHMTGDWGEIGEDDWRTNDEALAKDRNIVSSYLSQNFDRFMIVTEADRSVTTILLPDEL